MSYQGQPEVAKVREDNYWLYYNNISTLREMSFIAMLNTYCQPIWSNIYNICCYKIYR